MNDPKEINLSNLRLSFPGSLSKKSYGLCLEKFIDKKKTARLHYTLHILCIKNYTSEESLYEIDRTQVYLNNRIPEDKVPSFTDACSKALFPVTVRINTRERKIKQILNLQEIQERWIRIKPQIEQYYKGEIIDNLIQKTTLLYKQEKPLMQTVWENWFFRLYFSPVYTQYSPSLESEEIWTTPLSSKGQLFYKAQQKIESNYSSDDKITIHVQGKAIHPVKGETPEAEFYPSEFRACYTLHKKDHSPATIQSTFTTQRFNRTETIQISLYDLSRKVREIPASRFLYDPEEKKTNSSRGFWIEE